jgi:PadR family transcriptional regulator, regulatory protein PadR
MRIRKPSRQAIDVMGALGRRGDAWSHGYDLARETDLKSGSLYPILARLSDQGLLEARWEQEVGLGRPPRHLYRLTATGRAALRDLDLASRAHAVARATAGEIP